MNSDQVIADLVAKRTANTLHPDCHTEGSVAPMPVGRSEVLGVEASLGFKLPPFLRRLYTEVANGRFGPDFGLLPAVGDKDTDLVSVNERERQHGDWPSHMLIIGDIGCRLYHCVNVQTLGFSTFLFDADTAPENCTIEQQFLPVTDTIEEFFAAWLQDDLPFPSHPESVA